MGSKDHRIRAEQSEARAFNTFHGQGGDLHRGKVPHSERDRHIGEALTDGACDGHDRRIGPGQDLRIRLSARVACAWQDRCGPVPTPGRQDHGVGDPIFSSDTPLPVAPQPQ